MLLELHDSQALHLSAWLYAIYCLRHGSGRATARGCTTILGCCGNPVVVFSGTAKDKLIGLTHPARRVISQLVEWFKSLRFGFWHFASSSHDLTWSCRYQLAKRLSGYSGYQSYIMLLDFFLVDLSSPSWRNQLLSCKLLCRDIWTFGRPYLRKLLMVHNSRPSSVPSNPREGTKILSKFARSGGLAQEGRVFLLAFYFSEFE